MIMKYKLNKVLNKFGLMLVGKNEMRKIKNRKKFEKLSRPLIKFLCDNYHPHTQITIDCNHAELSEGLIGFSTDDYIK